MAKAKAINRWLIEEVAAKARGTINAACIPGMGISAAATGHFYREIWARDLAVLSMVADEYRVQLRESIAILLSYQKENGELPLRVEFKHHRRQFLYQRIGLRRFINRKKGHPVYATDPLSVKALDTIPCVLIARGALFRLGGKEREFVIENYNRLALALCYLDRFIDPQDGLMIGGKCQDWADCIDRIGKLADNNILLYQAYRIADMIARARGRFGDWRYQAQRLHKSILRHFWVSWQSCFRAGTEDNTIDLVATLFGKLFLPKGPLGHNPALETHRAGLISCFDQPYPWHQISWRIKIFRMRKYGHQTRYPWLSAAYILLQTRMGRPDIDAFMELTRLLHQNGSFYEVYDNETLKPYQEGFYRSSVGFVASAAAYLAAYKALVKGGYI